MTVTSIGDLSQFLVSRRHNVALRQKLDRLTSELSTGQVADLTRHLGRDTGRLNDLDRRIALSQARVQTTRSAGQTLAVMQNTLARVDEARSTLASEFAAVPLSGTGETAVAAVAAGLAGFTDLAQALNVQFGGRSLFAGQSPGGPALAPPDQMLAELRIVAAGAVTATDLATAIDDWFDAPGGGFETTGYVGDQTGYVRHQTDEAEFVTVGIRADDPALRETFKALALAALSGDDTSLLPQTERVAALRTAGERLFSAADEVVTAQATLGRDEARVDQATARHGARLTAYGLLRNEMTAADPYDTASALQETEAMLERHYIVTARLSGLTLAGYLR